MRIIQHLSCLVAATMLLVAFAWSDQNSVHAASNRLVVIVSQATPIRDISTAVLRRAFLGYATEYAGGKRLIPINNPLGTPARVSFDRSVLSLEPHEVGPFWIDRRIRDQSGPPKTVPSADLALRVVMSLAGAISYAYPDQINDKVRALTIDGKTSESTGYLLVR
jgi:hypothetical protein